MSLKIKLSAFLLPFLSAGCGRGHEFLVYHWRGEHDFLYLTVREETVLDARWWYAGELCPC
jgi:hypothetical protein